MHREGDARRDDGEREENEESVSAVVSCRGDWLIGGCEVSTSGNGNAKALERHDSTKVGFHIRSSAAMVRTHTDHALVESLQGIQGERGDRHQGSMIGSYSQP